MSPLPFCGPSVPIECMVLRLDPLGSLALGLLGTWSLALLDLECFFDNSSDVSIDCCALPLLPFCCPSLPIGCKVSRLDPLPSWALGFMGSWALGVLGTLGLALLDLERLFDDSVVGLVSSSLPPLSFCGPSLPIGCKVLRLDPLGSWILGFMGSWELGILDTWGLGLLDLERLFDNSGCKVLRLDMLVIWSLELLAFWSLGLLESWAVGSANFKL
jgi:hypothetical protein